MILWRIVAQATALNFVALKPNPEFANRLIAINEQITMRNTTKYAIISLITFTLSLLLLLYGTLTFGVFSTNKIIISTLATTGPDFNVIFGNFKLLVQMPDSVTNTDVGGIMVTEESVEKISHNLIRPMDFQDYYLVSFKMAGIKKSDGDSYHPLLEITSCKRINFLLLWFLIITEFGLLILFGLTYSKFKKTKIILYNLPNWRSKTLETLLFL